MNSRVGQLAFPSNDNQQPGDKPYSDSTAEAMDEEARAIVDEAYQRTLNLMIEKKEEVAKVAALLREKETITHDDVVELIGKRPFGDKAYDEYVSSKAAALKKQEEAAAEQAEKEANEELESGPLTPGLA